jgi:hypothetical protein
MEGLHHPDHHLGGQRFVRLDRYAPTKLLRPRSCAYHPKSQWTETDPREDIPIWIFTLDQWNRIQNDHLIVSAAPFPPTELGHNKRFVFALPPRYLHDELAGWEEVFKINTNHPLHPY